MEVAEGRIRGVIRGRHKRKRIKKVGGPFEGEGKINQVYKTKVPPSQGGSVTLLRRLSSVPFVFF